MIVTGHANFFEVTDCGLFKHGSDVAIEPDLDLSDTFDSIGEWVKGKPRSETLPWDPATTRTGMPKCYCHDFYKCDSTGEFLLVLWKSDTDSAGTLWGASEDEVTGQGKVIEYTNNYKGSKVIWGRPCYYWIIPRLKTIVSLKFDHSVCDSQMLQDWVSHCINNQVKHPTKTRHLTEAGFVRFSFNERQAEYGDARYAYRFDVRLRSLNTATAEMVELSSKVTHIVRREMVRIEKASDDRASWVKVFDTIPFINAKPKSKSRQIEIKAEAKPTPAEIKQIVEQFSREHRKATEWENVGFETDTGTVWVDRYRLHCQVNISQQTAGIFSAAVLHSQLASKRAQLLAPVERALANESGASLKTGT